MDKISNINTYRTTKMKVAFTKERKEEETYCTKQKINFNKNTPEGKVPGNPKNNIFFRI